MPPLLGTAADDGVEEGVEEGVELFESPTPGVDDSRPDGVFLPERKQDMVKHEIHGNTHPNMSSGLYLLGIRWTWGEAVVLSFGTFHKVCDSSCVGVSPPDF